ncbi:polysaccharide deacetylase family protein [Nonomuraea sp. NPDC050547]|uniref:polysaccharide deacetylase family protein n=1 Tax=Nonomuraea sp. NPDC050547 TaxID=3364368 RepID=UPI0037ACD626
MSGILLLTFDDFFVPEWRAAREVFRAHGARVTFFVSEPWQVRSWAGLRDLAADGHSVGAHGFRHLRADERVAEAGGAAYLREEIEPCLAALAAEGLRARSFAYPNSARSPASDTVLTTVFDRLRGGRGVPDGAEPADVGDFFVPVAELPRRRVLIGAGADNGRMFRPRGLTDAALLGALRRAADREEALTLYAHAIAPAHEANYLAPDRLDRLLAEAARLGLRCLGFDDLPAPA